MANEPVAGPDFDIRVSGDAQRTVLSLSGELDLETAPALRSCLHATVDGGCCELVVDVAGLRFMDSSGISVLVDALQRLRRQGGSLAVRSPGPNVRRVLELAGLMELFGLA